MGREVFFYGLKCVGALFAVFLMSGAIGSLILGGKPVVEENITIGVALGMSAAAIAGAAMFWPKWPWRKTSE